MEKSLEEVNDRSMKPYYLLIKNKVEKLGYFWLLALAHSKWSISLFGIKIILYWYRIGCKILNKTWDFREISLSKKYWVIICQTPEGNIYFKLFRERESSKKYKLF